MKILHFTLLLVVLIVSSCNRAKAKLPGDSPSNTLCLFQTPLVLGASVSAGHGTESGGPAAILSKILNNKAVITNKAISGATSVTVTKDILDIPDSIPSIVLGLDLFFWDAARNQCGKDFEDNTRRIFKLYQSNAVPLIIGKIPVGAKFPAGLRLAGNRACTKVINSLLEELCTIKKNCLLYDPKDCLDEMRGAKSPEGKDFFQDELHTSHEGNKFCAEKFVEAGDYKNIKCTN